MRGLVAVGGLGSGVAKDGTAFSIAEEPTAGAVFGSLTVSFLEEEREVGAWVGGVTAEGTLIRTVSLFAAVWSPFGGSVMRMVSLLSVDGSEPVEEGSEAIKEGSLRIALGCVQCQLDCPRCSGAECGGGNFHLPGFFCRA